MPTISEEEGTSLFTIEQIAPAPSPISMLSGCALCQHCSLLRLLVLKNYDNVQRDSRCHKPAQAHVDKGFSFK